MEPIKHHGIIRVDAIGFKSADDVISVEEPLEIRVSYHTYHGVYRTISLAVTMRTPGNDVELAKGFLFTEGVISDPSDIIDISDPEENIILIVLNETVAFDADKLKRNFYTTSSCGVCGKASIDSIHSDTIYLPWKSDLKVSKEVILSLKSTLLQSQSNFNKTGGIHACALFDNQGELISLKEDVGRHNAMDKLIGGQSIFPLSAYLVVVSGRASFELVQKASKAGIPILVSIGAPSSLAIQLAEEQGMCLIGFLKTSKFNIYTGEKRVV